MKNKWEIGIWGQFGDGGKIADGQAVRTTIITKEMQQRYGSDNILVLNTEGWQKNPFDFLFKSVRLYLSCKKVIIFPADNGFKTIVPIYDFLYLFFKRELYDVVIGGYLPELLKKNNRYLKKILKYKALFVQTPNLKKDLEKLGLNNIHILSNLKRLPTVKKEEIYVNKDEHIKVCTLSRIDETKGIEYAIEAVKIANKKIGDQFISLDCYGIIMPDYKERFDGLLKENEGMVTYGGVLDYDNTTETLKHYFALLFPTYYYGEGFPGNVVDAYNAAVPIIATDWLYNKDVIEHQRNGILVPIKDAQALADALVELYYDRKKAFSISMNNLDDSKKYTPDIVLKEFYSFFDNKEQR